MQGRGRGQLPPLYKAPTFLLLDSICAPSRIASVTYDDPTGSWESWEPGAGWGSVGGGRATPNGQAERPELAQPHRSEREESGQSEPGMRWDEDGDTNLRDPKQLPRTLITMSELDWEDSEECATELWQHPQRRAARAEAARGMRPQMQDPTERSRRPTTPDVRARGAGRAPANARVNGAAHAQPSGRNGAAYTQRSAEPTARLNTAVPERPRAPQRLPKAPPPRAAEPEPPTAPRGRTTTQPGAAHAQVPQPGAATLSADAELAAALSVDPQVGSQLSSAPVADARQALQPPAARPRSLLQTQVSGFGTAPSLDLPPPPAGRASTAPRLLPTAPPARPELSEPPQEPQIESLRQRLVTPRMLPPRPQNTGHIPTILGTPSAGRLNTPELPRAQPPAAAPVQPHSVSPAPAQAIEQLQEQLLEAMARARVQEARAAEAEKTLEQVEEQLESIVRTHASEADELREQLRQTSGQLRLTETRVADAERRSMVSLRPQNVLHLSDAELTPRHHKQGRANLILSGLLASSLSFGGAAYFMFYAPLQKQLQALEQQRTQDAQAQANALTNLKAQSAAERQGLETQNAELRAQLEAARAEALAMNADDGKRGRSRRGSSADADSDEETPPGTRSARAIERRMRRSRSAAPAEEAEAPAPARSSRPSSRDGNDPLDGI